MAQIDDRSGVAISKEEAGKRGSRTTFGVDDIDAGIARVKELGGEATDRRPVPSMGWFSVCSDRRETSSACGRLTRLRPRRPVSPHDNA